MQQRRRGFFQRLGDLFNRLAGGRPQEEEGEPPVIEEPIPPEEPEEPDYEAPEPPEPEPQYPEYPGGGGRETYDVDVYYVDPHVTYYTSSRGNPKGVSVKGYHTIHSGLGNIDIASVQELLNKGDTGGLNTRLVIHGVPKIPYPGKEGMNDIWLSFSVNSQMLFDTAKAPDNFTAEDWINDWVAGQLTVEGFDEVYDIKVVDQ